MHPLFALTALSLSLLSQQAPVRGEIAQHYRDVLAEQSRALATSKSNAARGSILRATERRLEQMLMSVKELEGAALTEDDCVALSASAQRLKQYELGLEFARRAAMDGATIRPYVEMIRCLGQLERPGEAERVITTAERRFARDERFYLLHNLLAFSYQARKDYELACRHYEATIDLVIGQVSKNAFYVGHLERCVREFANLASRTNADDHFSRALDKWASAVRRELSAVGPDDTQEAAATPIAEEVLRKRCLHHRAMCVVEKQRTVPHIEDILEEWAATLLRYERGATPRNAWIEEASAFVDEVPKALAPNVRGDVISGRIAHLSSALAGSEGADEHRAPLAGQAHARAKVALAFVDQHRRHRSLEGTHLFHDVVDNARGGGTAPRFFLVHVFDPSSKTLRDGVHSAQSQVKEYRSRCDVKLCFVAMQIRAAPHEATGRPLHSETQAATVELGALGGLEAALQVSEPVLRLEPQSDDARRLDAVALPLNVLLDESGRVLCILAGHEPEKVAHLLKLAENARGK